MSQSEEANTEKGQTTFIPYEVEDGFEDYMRSCAPHVKEHEVQYRESRRVWVAATRRLLVHLTEYVPDFSDEEGVNELERLRKSTEDYWWLAIQDKD